MISWSQLEAYFATLFPDNNQKLIAPSRLRTGLSALMRAFESAVQYAVPDPQKRSIPVFRAQDRSWKITLAGSSNTIGLFAFTTVTKRLLILDEHFVIIGTGVNRTFTISDETFDDLYPGEKIIYTENVKGGQIEFKIPQFKIQEVNGGQKYGWEYPDDPSSFTAIGDVGEPKFPETQTIPIPYYQGGSVYYSSVINSTGIRILPPYTLYVEGLPRPEQVVFDPELKKFVFSVGYDITNGTLSYRVEPV